MANKSSDCELVLAWQGACNNSQPSLSIFHISWNIDGNDVNKSWFYMQMGRYTGSQHIAVSGIRQTIQWQTASCMHCTQCQTAVMSSAPLHYQQMPPPCQWVGLALNLVAWQDLAGSAAPSWDKPKMAVWRRCCMRNIPEGVLRVTRVCKPKYVEVLGPLQMLRTSTARLSHIRALQSGSVEQSAPSAGNTNQKGGHWAAPYKITHNITANNDIEEMTDC